MQMPENDMSDGVETQTRVEATNEATVRRSTRVPRPLERLDPSWT